MKSQRNKIFSITVVFQVWCFYGSMYAQQQQIGIGFYNVENLFDIVNDSLTIDEEFTPNGIKHWTAELYEDKLQRLSTVILQLSEEKMGPLAILGVCEIENRKVLEDLTNSTLLKDKYYKIVHHNSPDLRGVDVALLYQPKYFTVLQSQSIKIPLFESDGRPRLTRDVLLVKGKLHNQLLFVLVNHWPSRRGGEESKSFRAIAAKVNRELVDSLGKTNPDAAIIIMGDLNDNPDDDSLQKGIPSEASIENVEAREFFNPFYKNHKNGEGTTPYDDAWNVFDQILISRNILPEVGTSEMKFLSHQIFSKSFMLEKEGHFKNYPKRSFSGDRYNYGYSDHFPVICYFVVTL